MEKYFAFIRQIPFYIVIIIVFYSCKWKDDSITLSTEYTHSIVEDNLLEIPLDKYTKPFSFFTQTFKSGNISYLVILNERANQLQFYDLDKKEIIFKVKYNHSGPNGVGDIRHFFVHNLDSIFILRNHANTVFLTDSSAAVYDSHRISNQFDDNSFVFLFGLADAPLLYRNGDLYIRSISDYGSCDQNLYQSNQPIMIKYELGNKKTINMAQFPNSYKSENWDSDQAFFLSYTYNSDKENLVFSFPASHYLFVRDLDGALVDSILCQSDYIDKIVSYNNNCQDLDYLQQRHFMETPTYYSVIYDSYNKVYYRLALLPSDVNSFPQDKGYPNDRISYKIPVIMVFDEDFNKIAENKLPQNTYLPFDHFVAKEGLYISLNHDKSKYLEEDKLKYMLFKLEEMKLN